MEIQNLAKYKIAFVNPSWKEDAHDLLLKYKGDDQVVEKKTVRFALSVSIDLEDFARRNGYERDDIRPSYTLSFDNEEYEINVVSDVYGNPYIDNTGKVGVFFLEIGDEYIDKHKVDADKDYISKKTYKDIEMYVVRKI